MNLSVIMPVYNEINTLEEIIKRVKDVDIAKEIIIIDDSSTDGSAEYLKELKTNKDSDGNIDGNNQIKVFFHQSNMGKGAAIKTGIEHVSGDVVIIQDADLEYNPGDYHKLLIPILDGRADVVYGSRLAGNECQRVLFFWHYLGNKLLTLLSNMLTNLNLTDMETGYKVFKIGILKDIKLEQKRFGFEPEVTAKIAKKKLRIFEVGISYSGRTYDDGKKITYKDGIKALWYILKYNLFR